MMGRFPVTMGVDIHTDICSVYSGLIQSLVYSVDCSGERSKLIQADIGFITLSDLVQENEHNPFEMLS